MNESSFEWLREKAMIQGNKDPVSHKERWGFLCCTLNAFK